MIMSVVDPPSRHLPTAASIEMRAGWWGGRRRTTREERGTFIFTAKSGSTLNCTSLDCSVPRGGGSVNSHFAAVTLPSFLKVVEAL